MISTNYKLVYELLSRVDADFNPPLSSSLDLVEYSKKICTNASLFKKIKNNSLIGLCAIYATDKSNFQAYLTMLAIDPVYRGLGLAKELLTEMEEYVLSQGFKCIRLEVYKTNVGAFLMYKSFGYEIVEESCSSYFLQKKIK
ncbi:MAG: GNAT family N-acetyltransferase [Shewanella algae]